MTAIWLLVRDSMRQRWPALAALAILIGLAGGVVLTAAANLLAVAPALVAVRIPAAATLRAE